jgi:hypothetical protein
MGGDQVGELEQKEDLVCEEGQKEDQTVGGQGREWMRRIVAQKG